MLISFYGFCITSFVSLLAWWFKIHLLPGVV